MLISTWYRPPSAKIELFQKFENLLKLIDNEEKDIIITGDLNCNFIEHTQNQATSKLIDIIDIFQLQQHIQTPTRTTYNSSSLIDLILTHIDDDKTLEAGVVDLGISDQSLNVYICRKISIPKEPPEIVFTRQFKNYNSHQFKEELSYYTKLDPTSNDPNVLWNEFKNNFLTIAEKHAPVRQRRVKSELKPWLTKEIKRLMHHRDYLKRQSVRLTSSNYNEVYKRCKNKLNKLIKKTKEEYFKTKLSNASHSKESWQAINELLNKKPINVDDQVITGDTNIADCFNQYFSSIGCKLSNNVQNIDVNPMTFVTPTESSFHFSCISVQETFDALNQLNLRKSPGLDGISVKLLKDTSDVIAQPLANIFNLSLQTAFFPEEWKIAKVSPVFKEGNKTDCGNYRPISVISVVAKLFEGLVYNQLRTFIADNSILVDQQSGFRSQHSTETALLGSTNEWLYNVDSGLINGVLYLDLKKAFDTVDHEIFLKKIHLYGIKGTTYAWFKSYIQNRKSICLMNGKKSHAREIRCGVPQGSNLGPILFLLYITKANLFADGTNLSCVGLDANEIETKLKRDLDNVHSWLRCNKLTLNDSKREVMIIGSRHHLTKFEDIPEISLAIRDNNIKQVTNKKSLGFIIDDQLKWGIRIDAQCKKISKNIVLLRRAKSFVPLHILIKMYNALVSLHLTYCSTIWNDGSNTILNKLSKLRVITGQSYDIRSTQILESLNWMPIEDILKKREIIMTFKALTNRLPDYVQNFFTRCENSNYSLRSNNVKLSLPKPRTNFLKRSFSYRAAQGWNELSDEVTNNIQDLSLPDFKRRLTLKLAHE